MTKGNSRVQNSCWIMLEVFALFTAKNAQNERLSASAAAKHEDQSTRKPS